MRDPALVTRAQVQCGRGSTARGLPRARDGRRISGHRTIGCCAVGHCAANRPLRPLRASYQVPRNAPASYQEPVAD
jgi:hypothetical protein